MDRGAWWAIVHGVTGVRHHFMTKPPEGMSEKRDHFEGRIAEEDTLSIYPLPPTAPPVLNRHTTRPRVTPDNPKGT